MKPTTQKRLSMAAAALLLTYGGLAIAGGHELPIKASAWKVSGFAQLTAEHSEDTDGLDFGADRTRVGLSYDSTQLFGKLLLDFNVNNGGQRVGGTLTNMVKDAFVGWRFNRHWSSKFGQFKSPIGMDFNTPGTNLDITKRGMEKPLVFERDTGVMLSGRKLGGGFGLDLGIFNPADRSGAVNQAASSQTEANAYAARLLWDHGNLHAQLSAGVSGEAGGLNTEDYSAADLGMSWKGEKLRLKGEVIYGDGILGTKDRSELVWFAHLGYKLCERRELIVRHYAGSSEIPGSADTDLGNTYVGFNYWPKIEGPAALRLQLNYVIASGDETAYTGLGGFKRDALLFQLQIKSK